MQFTQNIIEKSLIELGISFNPNRINKDWMQVLCPSHHDTHFGSASINLSSGVISCFVCGHNTSIIKLFMERKNCSYKEIIKYIFDDFNFFIKNDRFEKIEIKEKKQSFKRIEIKDYTTMSFSPEDFYYTKIRGYTKEFCEKFNIRLCLGSEYDDYFLTPIIDTKKNINIIEARKLKQREYIYKYLNLSEKHIRSPEQIFKEIKEKRGYKLNKNYEIVNKKNQIINNIYLKYLLKPKTLYPKNVDVDFTIWNIDNLDRIKELYVSEGLATIPKIYQHITKNCTSIFGTKITKYQIEYLKEFKNKIIIIPDNDEACFLMIKLLNEELDNIWVLDIKIDDTYKEFVQIVQYCSIIRANEWLLKNMKFL